MDGIFYGVSIRKVLRMPYEDLAGHIREAANKDYLDIVVDLTERRLAADTDVERAACSRIISSLMDGPDILDV